MADMVGEAAYVKAPMSGAVIQVDISASGATWLIPEAFAGCQCTFEIYGDSEAAIGADIAFGSASMTLTYGQDSTAPGAGVITVVNTTGMKLVSGSPKNWVMPLTFGPGSATSFYIIASGNGKLKIAKS